MQTRSAASGELGGSLPHSVSMSMLRGQGLLARSNRTARADCSNGWLMTAGPEPVRASAYSGPRIRNSIGCLLPENKIGLIRAWLHRLLPVQPRTDQSERA